MNAQQLYNPFVTALLRSPLHGVLSQSTMLLTVKGRKSGRTFTFPTNYVRDSGGLLIMTQRRRAWWHNLEQPTRVGIYLEGREMTGTACAYRSTDAVREKLIAMVKASRALQSYFGVRVDGNEIDGVENLDDALAETVIVQVAICPQPA